MSRKLMIASAIGRVALLLACLAGGIAFGASSYIAIESWKRPPLEAQQPDPCRMPQEKKHNLEGVIA